MTRPGAGRGYALLTAILAAAAILTLVGATRIPDVVRPLPLSSPPPARSDLSAPTIEVPPVAAITLVAAPARPPAQAAPLRPATGSSQPPGHC